MGQDRVREIVSRLGEGVPGASQSWIDGMAKVGHLSTFKKGLRVYGEGQPADAVRVVGSGRIALGRTTNGRMLGLGTRASGEVFGEEGIFGATALRETAMVVESAEIVTLPLSVFRAEPTVPAGMPSWLTELQVRRRQEAEDLAASFAQTVESRIAGFLLTAAKRWGIPDPRGTLISAAVTHQEIASAVASTRETVTVTIGALRKKGTLDLDRRKIVIIDRAQLESLAAA